MKQAVILWAMMLSASMVGVGVSYAEAAEPIRVGVIGLDTSHAIAFTNILNAENPDEDVAGCVVVAAFPKGSPDIESSTSRIPKYTEDIQKLGVEIVDSIPALLEKVDAVLLETNDGRPHLEQAALVFAAGKPVFIDKPLAGSLADCIAIRELGLDTKTPWFSSSSLRYVPDAQDARAGKFGKVTGCDTFSPCSLEKTHPDLFWYGIHGVEELFTIMGAGCESVSRTSAPDYDHCVGKWSDGRIGTFRGLRAGKRGYGGMVYTDTQAKPLGPYAGYRPLVVDIVKFFRTKQPPIDVQETIEIYAFMEAADESKRRGGMPVLIADVIRDAEEDADKRLAELKAK